MNKGLIGILGICIIVLAIDTSSAREKGLSDSNESWREGER